MHEARQTSTGTEETRTGVAHSSTQQLAVGPNTPTPHVYTYLCPHCAKSVQSTVTTGQIDHRRGDGCGKLFRVANGVLAGRTRAHTCPTCRHGGAFNKSFRPNSNHASYAQRKAVSHRPMGRAELITNGGFTKQRNSEGRTGTAGHGPQCLALLSEPTRKLAVLVVFQPRRLTNGAFATPKQQGPEGRTGPAGHGPQCLTLLSEPTRKLAL